MIISVAGLNVAITPDGAVSEPERRFLARFPLSLAAEVRPDLTVRLEPERPRSSRSFDDSEPVRVHYTGNDLRLVHSFIDAAIPLSKGDVLLHRDDSHAAALHLTIRTAVCTRLPETGALPLHAAAMVVNGRAAIFYGPSGAGKSTIAGSSRFPVLSDELVVLRVDTLEATSAGFWGELDRDDAPSGSYPVGALFELQKASGVSIARQTPEGARRKLYASLLVPPASPLWSRAITLVEELSGRARFANLAWSRSCDPWLAIEHLLDEP